MNSNISKLKRYDGFRNTQGFALNLKGNHNKPQIEKRALNKSKSASNLELLANDLQADKNFVPKKNQKIQFSKIETKPRAKPENTKV